MYQGKFSMLLSPLFRNKEDEIGKRGFLCSHVPGGSDPGLFVPGPFLLALSFPWFPGDWSKGIRQRSGRQRAVAGSLCLRVSSLAPSFLGESFLLISLLIWR